MYRKLLGAIFLDLQIQGGLGFRPGLRLLGQAYWQAQLLSLHPYTLCELAHSDPPYRTMTRLLPRLLILSVPYELSSIALEMCGRVATRLSEITSLAFLNPKP